MTRSRFYPCVVVFVTVFLVSCFAGCGEQSSDGRVTAIYRENKKELNDAARLITEKKTFDKEDAKSFEVFRLLVQKGLFIQSYQDECIEVFYPGKPLDGDLYFIYTKQKSKLNGFIPMDKNITSLGDDWYWFWK